MPIIFTGNDSNGFTATTNNDRYVTREFEFVTNDDGDAFDFGARFSNSYLLQGTILTDEGHGIASERFNDILIESTGSISADFSGIFGSGRVTNLGYIDADVAGVFIESGSVRNLGTIQGDGSGISVAGTDIEIFNSGHIFSSGRTIRFFRDETGVSSLINSGTIEGGLDGAIPTILGSTGVQRIRNSGDIFGDVELLGGNDRFLSGASGFVGGVVNAGDGDDRLRGGDAEDHFQGSNGNDTVSGGGGADRLEGNNGADLIRGNDGDDTLLGGSGTDTLRGGRGDDELNGGRDADRLIGGRGDDGLTGGAGADVFVFGRNSSDDTILDFQNGSDAIDLSALGLRFGDIGDAISNRRGNAIIDLDALGGDGSVMIIGAAGDLDASDFIF